MVTLECIEPKKVFYRLYFVLFKNIWQPSHSSWVQEKKLILLPTVSYVHGHHVLEDIWSLMVWEELTFVREDNACLLNCVDDTSIESVMFTCILSLVDIERMVDWLLSAASSPWLKNSTCPFLVGLETVCIQAQQVCIPTRGERSFYSSNVIQGQCKFWHNLFPWKLRNMFWTQLGRHNNCGWRD